MCDVPSKAVFRRESIIIIIIIVIIIIFFLIFVKNLKVVSDSADVKAVRYHLNISHCSHICNIYLTSNISYAICRHVYDLWPYETLLA